MIGVTMRLYPYPGTDPATALWSDQIALVFVSGLSADTPTVQLSGACLCECAADALELRRLRGIAGWPIDERAGLERHIRELEGAESLLASTLQRLSEEGLEREVEIGRLRKQAARDDWRVVEQERAATVRYLDGLRSPIDPYVVAREIQRGDHWTGQSESPTESPASRPHHCPTCGAFPVDTEGPSRTSTGLTGSDDPGYDPGMATSAIPTTPVSASPSCAMCGRPIDEARDGAGAVGCRDCTDFAIESVVGLTASGIATLSGIAARDQASSQPLDAPNFTPQPGQEPRSGSGEGGTSAPTPDLVPETAPGAQLAANLGVDLAGLGPRDLWFDARRLQALAQEWGQEPAGVGEKYASQLLDLVDDLTGYRTPITYGYGIVDKNGRPYCDDCACEDRGPMDDTCADLNDYSGDDERTPYRVVRLLVEEIEEGVL